MADTAERAGDRWYSTNKQGLKRTKIIQVLSNTVLTALFCSRYSNLMAAGSKKKIDFAFCKFKLIEKEGGRHIFKHLVSRKEASQ